MDSDVGQTAAPAWRGRGRFGTLPGWLAAASTLLYALSRFVPWTPPDASQYSEMDLSWVQYLHQAFLERAQFGRDVVFTFGPWGFLYGGYHPGTHAQAIVAWTLLTLAFWSAAWKLSRHLTSNLVGAWLWQIAFTTVAGVTFAYPNLDARLYAFVILLLALYFFVEDRSPTLDQAALAVSLALIVLIKASMLVLAAGVLLLMATDAVWRRRRFPWLALIFGAALMLFWLAAGQGLRVFPAFVVNSGRITGGYTEAMMLDRGTDARDAISFLLAATVVCGLITYTAWLRFKKPGLLAGAAFVLVLFTSFKYGYVRHDAHDVTSALELLLVALATLAVGRQAGSGGNRALALASFAQAGIILYFAMIPYKRATGLSLLANFTQGFAPGNILAPAKLISGAAAREGAEYGAFLAGRPTNARFPGIEGTVDMFPWNDVTALPKAARFRPRPVFHSYSVYTPELAALNADFLRRPGAPDYILLRPFVIDYHLPTLDDGPCWLEFLSRYDVSETAVEFTRLRRSETSRQWKLVPLEERTLEFARWQALPGDANALWAEIEADKTIAGSAVAALYKPQTILLQLHYRDGSTQVTRLVPGMARSGFLLSPLIANTMSYAELAAGDWAELTNRQATAIAITGDGKPRPAGYGSSVKLRLFRLEFPPQPAAETQSYRQLRSLLQALGRARLLRASRTPQITYDPKAGNVAELSADTALEFTPPARCRQLKLAFGLPAARNGTPGTTNAITFQVSTAAGGADPSRVWSRRLDPANDGDRGTQRTVIDLGGEATSRLLVETFAGDGREKSEAPCYLSEIQFE